MALEIIPVDSSRGLRRFIDLPWRIYNPTDHPQWVPPMRIAVSDALNTKSNPFYKTADRQLFLALRDGQPIGRIAAIENRAHNEFHRDRVGFFGFFECKEDQEAANALFAAAEKWLAARGLDTIRGPMNPSTNHEVGLLVDGFREHPMIMTTWNPVYYPTLVEKAGFSKAKDLLAYYFPMSGANSFQMPQRVLDLAKRALGGKELVFRQLDFNVTRASMGDVEAASIIHTSTAFADSRQLVARIAIHEVGPGKCEVEMWLTEDVSSQSVGGTHRTALRDHGFYGTYFAMLQQVLMDKPVSGGAEKN